MASGRLYLLDAEHLIVELTTPWSDGTHQLVFSPEELLEKLAALVPPPRLNLVRYHGVLAPNAADRGQIVPGPQQEHAAAVPGNGATPSAPPLLPPELGAAAGAGVPR